MFSLWLHFDQWTSSSTLILKVNPLSLFLIHSWAFVIMITMMLIEFIGKSTGFYKYYTLFITIFLLFSSIVKFETCNQTSVLLSHHPSNINKIWILNKLLFNGMLPKQYQEKSSPTTQGGMGVMNWMSYMVLSTSTQQTPSQKMVIHAKILRSGRSWSIQPKFG